MLLFCVPIIIFEAMFEAMFEANENKRRLEPRLKQRPHPYVSSEHHGVDALDLGIADGGAMPF